MGRPGSVSGGDESFVFKYCLSAAAATVAETGTKEESNSFIVRSQFAIDYPHRILLLYLLSLAL